MYTYTHSVPSSPHFLAHMDSFSFQIGIKFPIDENAKISARLLGLQIKHLKKEIKPRDTNKCKRVPSIPHGSLRQVSNLRKKKENRVPRYLVFRSKRSVKTPPDDEINFTGFTTSTGPLAARSWILFMEYPRRMCWNTLLLHTASCTTRGRRPRSLEAERENPRKKGVESAFLRVARLCARIHAYACALRRDLCRRRYLSLRIEMSVMRRAPPAVQRNALSLMNRLCKAL